MARAGRWDGKPLNSRGSSAWEAGHPPRPSQGDLISRCHDDFGLAANQLDRAADNDDTPLGLRNLARRKLVGKHNRLERQVRIMSADVDDGCSTAIGENLADGALRIGPFADMRDRFVGVDFVRDGLRNRQTEVRPARHRWFRNRYCHRAYQSNRCQEPYVHRQLHPRCRRWSMATQSLTAGKEPP